MVSTVKMFDPRVGSWMMEESMNEARGYFGAVVLRDSIYVLGGLNNNGTILDTVCISSRKCILLWHFMLGFRYINCFILLYRWSVTSKVMAGKQQTSKDLGGDVHFVSLFYDPRWCVSCKAFRQSIGIYYRFFF